jgi:hypothetical protein
MADTEVAMAGPSTQQLLACALREGWCSCSPQPAAEPAGQQSVGRAQAAAQAIAGCMMPRRHATTTQEANSRRTTKATSGPIY